MIALHRHIEYLLIGHDCVTVPALGAFIARREGACTLPDGSISAPRRVVGFNPDVNHDDGLLTASVARRSALPYQAAKREVMDAVGMMRRQLECHGEVSVGRVGRLWRDADGNIRFEEATNSTACFPLMGLRPIPATVSEQVADEEENAPAPKPGVIWLPISRRLVRVAAAVAILLCVGAVCSTFYIAGPGASTGTAVTASILNAFSPAESDEQPAETEEPMMADAVTTTTATMYIAPAPVADIAVEESTPEPEAAPSIDSKDTESAAPRSAVTASATGAGEYCVVVASLKSRKGATRFIKEVGDPSLRILEQEGRWRVYIATAATEDEAKAIAADAGLQKRFPGAWVTEK